MTVVASWTGREAGFLRQAMRLTVRDFAEDLGVNPRLISRWEATGDRTPGPELQQALDTVLERATEENDNGSPRPQETWRRTVGTKKRPRRPPRERVRPGPSWTPWSPTWHGANPGAC